MSILKKVFPLTIIASLMFGNLAFASDEPIRTKEENNSYTYGKHTIYASSSIAFMGAEWSDARDAWAFNYRFVGTGAGRYGPDKLDSNIIDLAVMRVKGESNTDDLSLWTSTSDKYIGSAPESTSSQTDYSFIEPIASLAITAINNIGASYLWSATGLMGSLVHEVDDVNDTETSLFRSWDWDVYPTHKSDVGQFFWFIVDVEPNEEVKISTEYSVFGPTYEVLSAGKGTRTLTAGDPDTSSTASLTTMKASNKDWNPGMMTTEQKEKYGIEEISRENFDKRAKELMISPRSIKEFKESDNEVFYYAHNFKEGSTKNKPSTPKEAFIEKINKQRDRSDLVVETYSTLDSINDDQQKVLEKHKKRLDKLDSLLNKLRSANMNNSKEIKKLQKSFDDVIKK